MPAAKGRATTTSFPAAPFLGGRFSAITAATLPRHDSCLDLRNAATTLPVLTGLFCCHVFCKDTMQIFGSVPLP